MQKKNVIGYTFYIVMTGGGRLLFYGGDDIVYFEDPKLLFTHSLSVEAFFFSLSIAISCIKCLVGTILTLSRPIHL